MFPFIFDYRVNYEADNPLTNEKVIGFYQVYFLRPFMDFREGDSVKAVNFYPNRKLVSIILDKDDFSKKYYYDNLEFVEHNHKTYVQSRFQYFLSVRFFEDYDLEGEPFSVYDPIYEGLTTPEAKDFFSKGADDIWLLAESSSYENTVAASFSDEIYTDVIDLEGYDEENYRFESNIRLIARDFVNSQYEYRKN